MASVSFEELTHNRRVEIVRVQKAGLTVDIHDAIIWVMDEDCVDIAQYGQNLSSIIVCRSEISSIDIRVREFMNVREAEVVAKELLTIRL